jgi:hypothetical protein
MHSEVASYGGWGGAVSQSAATEARTETKKKMTLEGEHSSAFICNQQEIMPNKSILTRIHSTVTSHINIIICIILLT